MIKANQRTLEDVKAGIRNQTALIYEQLLGRVEEMFQESLEK